MSLTINLGISRSVPFDFASYESVLTYLYSNENEHVRADGVSEKGAWAPVDGTEFLFFDGTVNEPMPRRDIANAHYLSKGVQITGFVLAGLAFCFAVVSGAWVFANRKNKLIMASQPGFLYLLCFGAALVAPSAVFLGFDERNGASEKQLDALCSAFPWFFVIGYLTMYGALFSKLWRLSKLLQLRRKAVNSNQVLLPFVVIIACSFIVLIVWQVVDPLVWDRAVTSVGNEAYETFGQCSSVDNGILPFLVPLGVLIFLAVTTTAVFSWKLRNVQSELSEARWIFAGIFIHMQTWLVGVPVLYITNGVSRDASYVLFVLLGFTFSTSQVALVIGPKCYANIRDKYFGGAAAPKPHICIMGNTTRVSGLAPPSSGGVTMNSQGSTYLQGTTNSQGSANTQGGSLTQSNQAEIFELKHQNIQLLSKIEDLEALLLMQAVESNESATEQLDCEAPEQYPEGRIYI